MLFLIVVLLITLFIYYNLIKPHNYWKNKGVPYIKPWPIFGNFGRFVFRMSTFIDTVTDLYNETPDKRYVGIYQFLQPALLIRDPELIRKITIEEFYTFSGQSSFVSEQNDNLAKKILSYLNMKTGWQDMRSILSPTFTSSKMKMIFDIIDESGDQLVNYFLQQKDDIITVEANNTFNRISNDVIASTAFGVQCNSLKDRNNEFYILGKKSTEMNGLNSLKFFAPSFSPILDKILKLRLINAESEAFFLKIIKEAIKYREENKVVRYDMLHLLIEARKNRLNQETQEVEDLGFAVVKESQLTANKKVKAKLTDEDITAQVILFFLIGFTTTPLSLTYISYELAINPDIQQKLHNEIEETLSRCNGKITYEALMRMKYLDCVVSENIRCISTLLTRKTIKPFTIEPKLPGETPVHLEKGTSIMIPTCGLHHDPKYYPNPYKFDPERFNDTNKHNIKPYTYLPFGSGPRNCIASRFVLMKIKLLIVKLVKDFEIVPVEQTAIPLKIAKGSLSLLPEEGIWLGFKRRA